MLKTLFVRSLKKKFRNNICDCEQIFIICSQFWEQGWRNTPECILYMIQRILELESDK